MRRKSVLFNAVEALETRRLFATITVTSALDGAPVPNDGAVTLREAIAAINAGNDLSDPNITSQNPTATDAFGTNDTIKFNIQGGGVQTIHSDGNEFVLAKPMTVDGYTQPGASANTLAVGDDAIILIKLDGLNDFTTTDGIGISTGGDGSVIRGLAIDDFAGAGVEIDDSSQSTIAGNFIGIDTDGVTPAGNENIGITIFSKNNTIGGTAPADRNVIADNGQAGISLGDPGASGTLIQGNYIGTNAAGTKPHSNDDGILVKTAKNTIGGTAAGAGNLISGNVLDGIEFTTTTNNVDISNNLVEGNYIGTSADGNSPLGNSNDGVEIFGAESGQTDPIRITIGGTVAGAGNVISANDAHGISFDVEFSGAAGSVIQGNYIGTNAGGTAPLGNHLAGIDIQTSDSKADSPTDLTIGGSVHGAGNVVSGNGSNEIEITQARGSVTVQGNLIGTNATGTATLVDPNSTANGIVFSSSNGNVIGGQAAGAGNLIAGEVEGILIFGGSQQNVVQGNRIGVLSDGSAAGNRDDGVLIQGHATNNLVGGKTSAAGNLIANNAGIGVELAYDIDYDPVQNTIERNSIYNNGGMGIDIDGRAGGHFFTGPNQNDSGDTDTGPNDGQNFPEMVAASYTAGTVTVSGTFNSIPDKNFTLDFYANDTVDDTGHGEGKQYIGAIGVTTDIHGNASFSGTFNVAIGANKFIAATATNASTAPYGDTSEFSESIEAYDNTIPPTAPSISIGDVSMSEGNSGTTAFTFTITRSGDLSGASSVQYATADGSATVADGDYQPVTNTIGFDPNQATKTITVLVNGDTKFETDETFTVNLSTPTGATIADAQATGTIVNDDALPTISIGNVSMKEGNNGLTEFDFPLTFSDNGPFSQNISFIVTTADGTAKVSDQDYQPVNGAGAAFVAGTNLSGKFLPVFVKGDTKVEGDETFTVTISSASGATIANATATGTILNDDSNPPPPPPPATGSAEVVTDPCDSTKTALEIDGTDNKDTITVTKSGSSQGKAVVKINGVNKGTFSFSGSIVVYGKSGADNISIDSAITRSAYIWGGDGNDTINGGGGNDILFGQGNDDSINGNAGRDILVGGDGTDRLNGGSGDDLLIAGDFKSAASMSQLCSIQKEWTRTDKTYAKRVTDLTNGGGYNTIKLNSSTLFSSTTLKDSMTGGADSDLFFAAMTGDKITDKASGETAVNIG